MHSLTFMIVLLIPFANGAIEYPKEMSADLRNEFFQFAEDRLQHIIKANRESPPPRYVQIVVSLIGCEDNWETERITFGAAQTTLEEETCGTYKMQEFCQEFPGRMVALMTGNHETGTSVMARYKCAILQEKGKKGAEALWTQIIIPLFVVMFVLVVIYNFRKVCTEESQKKTKLAPAIKSILENSMDTITLNSSRGKKPRKELARFDEDSDSSIGILFTL
ncbi:hypothetical protein B9Z55_006098 [Caenorhabditis nigoni]|uniref:Uncharacterized protein n=2 Tax=Caenorhabditis nigoni TaxID=1611254 RepID=A0A2G5V3S3_9PELO|nr:hypothetical protein B9Z55_006098 [Caenorhabditis nigoni]